MVEGVIHRQQRYARPLRRLAQPSQPPPVISTPVHGRAQPHRTRRPPRQPLQAPLHAPWITFRHHDHQKTVRILQQVIENQLARPLLRPSRPQRQQPAKTPPTATMFRINNDIRRTIHEHQTRAHEQTKGVRALLDRFTVERLRSLAFNPHKFTRPAPLPHLLRRRQAVGSQVFQRSPGAGDAGNRVPIRNAQPCMPQQQGRQHHVPRVRCAAQEREVCRGDQFGIRAHASIPWTYQRGIVALSPYKPARNSQNRRPCRSSTR